MFLVFQIFVRASDVLNLNEEAFKEIIQGDGLFLVEFFAPWCGHCKALAPEYETAATMLKEKGITLIQVDCTVETRLCETYEVTGYPTLKVFKDGSHAPYEGPRKATSIVSYMIKQTLPVVTSISLENFEDFKASDEIILIAFLDTLDDPLNDLFFSLASKYRNKYSFGLSSDPEVFKKVKVTAPAIYMFKKAEDVYIVYRGKYEYGELEAFLNSESLPLFGELLPETYERYISSKVPIGCIFVSSVEEKKMFEASLLPLAVKYRGKVSLVTIDATLYGGHAENLNLKQTWPAFAVQETASNKKYPFDQSLELHAENLDKFLDDYVSGLLVPTIKSEPLPETQDGPVTVVVANSFKDVVLDSHKDVLLEFYAPWCGHCKNLAPKYDILGELFKSNHELGKNVMIAKIDATANDIPDNLEIKGFPTIMLFAANNKGNPIEYNGPRTVESFIEFIHQKGHHRVNAMQYYLTKPSTQQESDSSDTGSIEHDEL
ncbi:hypothetical protein PMAC_001898 [Pneumocystis sp. 'macacae']|nr:hypothetical protein PMAC_001898 [Pneumocystis sp. 'macacae']